MDMSEITRDIEVSQASDFFIDIDHKVDGENLQGLSQAIYIIFNKKGVVVQKTLGNGITFDPATGRLTIHIDHKATLNIHGSFEHEAAVLDVMDHKTFILKGKCTIKRTNARTST